MNQPAPTPHGILLMAQRILEERGQQRDQPGGERSIPAVVAAFNALTGHSLTEQQGCLFMSLVKIKRSQTGKPDVDHYVDGAAYFALAGEAALSVVNEQLTTAETAHAELQDLLAQRAAQLGPVVTVRPCKACDGTGNCAINRDRYNTPCPACNGTGHRQFMEAACSAT